MLLLLPNKLCDMGHIGTIGRGLGKARARQHSHQAPQITARIYGDPKNKGDYILVAPPGHILASFLSRFG